MTEGAAQARATAARRRRIPEESGIFAVLVAVALVLSLISPSFRTVSNGFVLLVNGGVIMFLALGQSFVLLTGGIDLSTGANIAMTGVVAALLMKLDVPLADCIADWRFLCAPRFSGSSTPSSYLFLAHTKRPSPPSLLRASRWRSR